MLIASHYTPWNSSLEKRCCRAEIVPRSTGKEWRNHKGQRRNPSLPMEQYLSRLPWLLYREVITVAESWIRWYATGLFTTLSMLLWITVWWLLPLRSLSDPSFFITVNCVRGSFFHITLIFQFAARYFFWEQTHGTTRCGAVENLSVRLPFVF